MERHISWYSFVLTGAAALAASSLVSGFYEAAPQELTFCSNFSSGGSVDTNCVAAATNQIPWDYAAVMTNPVVLGMQDLASGQGILAGYPDLTSALPIYVDPDRSLSFLGSAGEEILWFYEDCTTQLTISQQGRIVPSTVAAGLSTAAQPAGRIELQTEVLRTFDGNCATSLSEMKACYEIANQCGGSSSADNENRQAFVRSIFEEYIQAGAMVPADIEKATGIAYKVSYR